MTSGADRALTYRIFDAALELDADARAAFVSERCGEGTELAREVMALLAIASWELLATTNLQGSSKLSAGRDLIGKEYGRFRLVALIGEGGMGLVYRAERIGGVAQIVAVKLLRCEITEASAARFVREAQLLARLEHPAIARLIDVGVKDGEPWIAIEFVPGLPIDEYCENHDVDLRSRVKLLALLADAAATAHRMLVVHRDIKPTNVLVTEDGRPKLIDFGIAAALRSTSDLREPTVDIRRLFTPHYAAPEQIAGEPVTVATDVFGLGALAYRVLTGRAPYSRSSSAVGYLLAVTQGDAELPSRAAAEMDPAKAHRLRGDLDAILLKALARKPAQRYATAQDLRADLYRYLDGVPVSARRQTAGYRAARFVRRNVLRLSVAAALLLAVSAGAAIYVLQARSVAQARDMAARRDDFLENLLKSADPRGGRRDTSVAQLLDSAALELDRKMSGEPLVEASMLSLIAQTNIGLGRYQEGLTANARELKILREHDGGALEIGQALSSRAELLRELGKWKEAEPVVREAVGQLTPLHAPRDLCGALFLLAVILAHTDHERDAEATYHQVIELEERGNSYLRAQRMYPLHGLAVTLGDLGRYAEAATYAKAALSIAQEYYPADNPDLLTLQTTYAGALVNTHRAAEAEPLFRQTIAAETRVLGAGHKDTLLAQLLLSDDLLELHRDAEAATVALADAQQLEALLGPDNMYTLVAWNNEATALCNDRREVEGLAMLRRVEAARERLLPPGDRYLYVTELGIGVCLMKLHRYAEAEAELKSAAQGLEAARGPHYRRTQQAYQALRDLYALTGQMEEASRWGNRVGS
jgi:tetratricopeptide (TPR) repeat protein/predicted Ser/Thr protein kinase